MRFFVFFSFNQRIGAFKLAIASLVAVQREDFIVDAPSHVDVRAYVSILIQVGMDDPIKLLRGQEVTAERRLEKVNVLLVLGVPVLLLQLSISFARPLQNLLHHKWREEAFSALDTTHCSESLHKATRQNQVVWETIMQLLDSFDRCADFKRIVLALQNCDCLMHGCLCSRVFQSVHIIVI